MHYHVDEGEDYLENENSTPFETMNEAIHFAANLLAFSGELTPSEQEAKRRALRRQAIDAGLHHTLGQSITLDLPDGDSIRVRSCAEEPCWIEIDLRSMGLLSG